MHLQVLWCNIISFIHELTCSPCLFHIYCPFPCTSIGIPINLYLCLFLSSPFACRLPLFPSPAPAHPASPFLLSLPIYPLHSPSMPFASWLLPHVSVTKGSSLLQTPGCSMHLALKCFRGDERIAASASLLSHPPYPPSISLVFDSSFGGKNLVDGFLARDIIRSLSWKSFRNS